MHDDMPPADLADPASDLRRGVALTGIGQGLCLVFTVVPVDGASGLWSIGLVPLLMGVGHLLAWRIALHPDALVGAPGPTRPCRAGAPR